MGSRMVASSTPTITSSPRRPGSDTSTSRGVKRSPLHDLLANRGAVFGSRGGWERPTWFAPAGIEPVDQPSFAEPNWSRTSPMSIAPSAVACVALIDQTSFAKFEITGPGALDAMQWLSVADMDKPAGTVTYTQLCNERGGIECDLTMNVREQHCTWSPARRSARTHMDWIRSNSPDDDSVRILVRPRRPTRREPVRPDGA